MKDHKKLNILVIADINPRDKSDLRNVFIYDYLRCIAPYCSVKVLSLSLVADATLVGNAGSRTEIKDDGIEIKNYSIVRKKPSVFIKPFYYLYWFYKAYKIGKQYRDIDIIHAHSAILHGTIAILLSKKLNSRLIFTEHTGPFAHVVRSGTRKLWTKYVMEKADAILCVSNHLKNEILENGIRPKKMIITYNPVATDLFRILDNNPKEKYKNILYTGRLDNFKGGYRALLAFKKISKKFPDWTLTIIGGGHDFNLIKQTAESDIDFSKRVFLLGAQPKEVIAREMQKTSFFLFPSNHESFGIAIAEAMASGLPVIVGNKSAPKEYVTEEFGMIVDPDNIDEIAKAAENMIQTFSQYHSQKICSHVVNNFGIGVFGKKMVEIYGEIYSKKSI